MNKLIAGLIVFFLLALLFFTLTPVGLGIMNTYGFNLRKVDDATNYQTIKQVEDTARAMIAAYHGDLLTYEQYKDSENAEEVSWANQAKMRVNRTASNYNNYILKNSFIWEDNIPEDIKEELPIVK